MTLIESKRARKVIVRAQPEKETGKRERARNSVGSTANTPLWWGEANPTKPAPCQKKFSSLA